MMEDEKQYSPPNTTDGDDVEESTSSDSSSESSSDGEQEREQELEEEEDEPTALPGTQVIIRDGVATSPDGTYTVSFGVNWAELISTKQTLYPVWRDSIEAKALAPPTPHRGPGETNYTLRATKNVIMHPGLVLKVTDTTGAIYPRTEQVKLSLIGEDKRKLPKGSCPCKGSGILKEPRPTQLDHQGTAVLSHGVLEMNKLQIGCVTGHRGHGVHLRVKAQFISEGPLRGVCVTSLPIEVGAKSPFSVVYSKKPKEPAMMRPGYTGVQEMEDLIQRYHLFNFHDIFMQNEVDALAFEALTEDSLTQMGITKTEDRSLILDAVNRYNTDQSFPREMVPMEVTPQSKRSLRSHKREVTPSPTTANQQYTSATTPTTTTTTTTTTTNNSGDTQDNHKKEPPMQHGSQ